MKQSDFTKTKTELLFTVTNNFGIVAKELERHICDLMTDANKEYWNLSEGSPVMTIPLDIYQEDYRNFRVVALRMVTDIDEKKQIEILTAEDEGNFGGKISMATIKKAFRDYETLWENEEYYAVFPLTESTSDAISLAFQLSNNLHYYVNKL